MGILMRNGINYSGSQLPSVTIEDSGKILTVNDNGAWAAQEVPTDEQVSEAVDEWLTAHPEATTTVQDNSLTWVKFNDVLKNMMFKLGITDSKSGELVSTSDAAEFPLKDLQSEITATQNLNGYEYPWVGGAGKNLCYVSDSNLFPRGDNLPIINNASTLTAYAKVPKNTNLVFSCATEPFRKIPYGFAEEPQVGTIAHTLSYTTVTTTSYTFNSGEYEYVGFYYGSTDYPQTNVQIEVGSTATAYAPYENICPISGRTEVNVTRTGKNLLPIPEWFNVGYSVTYHGITFKILEDGVVEVSGTNDGTGNADFYLSSKNASMNLLYLENGTYTVSINGSPDIHLITSGSGTNGFPYTDIVNSSRTSTVTNDSEPFFYIVLRVSSGTTIPEGTRVYLQYELGSTATAYEPYEGDTFNTGLGRTVYGGVLDLTTGELTVNTGLIASYNGETIGEPWISDRDRYVAGTTPTIGAQVVYTKDSETYQVDRTEVDAYFKNNTIWSDSGDVAVSYLVDAKTYIDNH